MKELNNTMWDKVYRKKDDVVSREIAEETILVPVRGRLADMQKIFSLNPTAEFVWKNLDGKKKLVDILNALIDRFDVAKDEAEKDISDFVNELMNADLIEEPDKS